jgi:hypothetical protein
MLKVECFGVEWVLALRRPSDRHNIGWNIVGCKLRLRSGVVMTALSFLIVWYIWHCANIEING